MGKQASSKPPEAWSWRTREESDKEKEEENKNTKVKPTECAVRTR
jgi:hypothetical protein